MQVKMWDIKKLILTRNDAHREIIVLISTGSCSYTGDIPEPGISAKNILERSSFALLNILLSVSIGHEPTSFHYRQIE